MKRNLMTLLLTIVMLLSACSNKEVENLSQRTEDEINKEINQTKEATESTTSAEEVENEQYGNVSVTLTEANKFSEGIAWVRFNNPDNNFEPNVGLLNKEGKIITNEDLIKIDEMGSEFIGGYSYINYDNGHFIIIDKEGNITTESPTDGAYSIITGGDGVYFVHQEIKSMEVNEDRYGFLDFNGKWIVEPSTDHPLYQEQRESYEMYYYYNGEHTFSSWNKYYKNVAAYNCDTGAGTVFELDNFFGYTYVADDNEEGEPFKISDGLGFFYVLPEHDGGIAYSYNKNIELKEIGRASERSWGEKIYYNNGIYFTGECCFSKEAFIKNGAFYDLSGTKLIDFSKYNVINYQADGFYEFYDGVAPVLIYGADKEYYISYININGEFLFEPIQIDHVSNDQGHGIASGDAVLVALPEEDGAWSGKRCIITKDGTVSEIAEGIDFSNQTKSEIYDVEFCDGYAWCDASQCFVGIDGEKLDTYVEIK